MNIVWTAVVAAGLAFLSVATSFLSPRISLSAGLAAITFAVLATRE